jgi:NaMN:DMB phosphoribosyltransferase
MKKNLTGIVGIAVAMAVGLLIATTATSSPTRVFVQLGGALIVVIAGIFAAVRGSRLWLLLSGLGIGLAAFLVFAVVGP